ncbi:hypothetical protein ACI6QG_04945 [Roseococcus sp. DSY-14]
MPRSSSRAVVAECAGIAASLSAAMVALALLGWMLAPAPILP